MQVINICTAAAEAVVAAHGDTWSVDAVRTALHGLIVGFHRDAPPVRKTYEASFPPCDETLRFARQVSESWLAGSLAELAGRQLGSGGGRQCVASQQLGSSWAVEHPLPFPLCVQRGPLLLSDVSDANARASACDARLRARLMAEEGSELSLEAWNESIGAISGFTFVKSGRQHRLALAIVQPCLVPDDTTPHYSTTLEGWPAHLRARALVLGALALLYERTVTGEGLSGAAKRCLSPLEGLILGELEEALQEAQHQGVDAGCQVMTAALTRVNWLPFSPEEADWLSFGTQVSVDALPAVRAALLLKWPQPPEDSFWIGDDSRLLLG